MIRAALTLLLLAAAGEAAACSCMRESLAERLDRAEVVARVRIEALRLDPAYAEALRRDAGGQDGFLAALRLEFTPIEPLKGRLADAATLLTGWGGGDCGLEVKPGMDLLLAGTPDAHGILRLDICSASRPLGLVSLLEQAGRAPRMSDDDRYFLGAVRDYLRRGQPIPECVAPAGVPPPPPPPGQPDPGRDACEARYPRSPAAPPRTSR